MFFLVLAVLCVFPLVYFQRLTRRTGSITSAIAQFCAGACLGYFAVSGFVQITGRA